jgi:Gas vesicle protein K
MTASRVSSVVERLHEHRQPIAADLHRAVAALQLRRAMRTTSSLPVQRTWTSWGSLPSIEETLPRRLNADPESVERGLAQVVLTTVEPPCQLMERQALRRIDDGSLSETQIEMLGQTFMKLADRTEELRNAFGLTADDLNLNLAPLGNLL